jgi:nucleoside 2-deoxyribosyltransferase
VLLAPDKALDDRRIISHTDCPEGITGEDIFNRDVAWINESDLVVANFNAPHFSPGTMWELGYAYALNKLIVAFGRHDQLSHPFVDNTISIGVTLADAKSVAKTINTILKVWYNEK